LEFFTPREVSAMSVLFPDWNSGLAAGCR